MMMLFLMGDRECASTERNWVGTTVFSSRQALSPRAPARTAASGAITVIEFQESGVGRVRRPPYMMMISSAVAAGVLSPPPRCMF
jgi:hypothetical protein